MDSAYRDFIELLKKYPFGERFLAHAPLFVGGQYVIWVILCLIAILAAAQKWHYRRLKSFAGLFLILVIVVTFAVFIFRLYTNYR